jgi:signal transduction histidine kinase
MAGSDSRDSGRRLAKLIAASRVINSTLDLDRLLHLILDAASQGVGADRGTLYLVDRESGELSSKVLQGTELVEIRLPAGKGIAGDVARTGAPAIIRDVYQDPRFNPEIDRRTGYRTRNMLCMPLKDRDGLTIGVLQLLNKKEGDFDHGDQEFLEALSAQAAVAVEHARMAQEMVRNERLSAVGGMAGSLVHDFRSPLGTIRIYAELLREKLRDEADRELADSIIRQVDRFLGMAQEILDFTRGVTTSRPRDVDFGEVVEGFLGFVEKDLEKGGVRLMRDLRFRGRVRVDPERLRRAFHNIVDNARDAMPQGGVLRVATAERDGWLCVEFSDEGAGMPEAVRRRVGEPFFTSGKLRGTGLGMAMVKRIVEEHGGRVEIESAPGKGTAVRLLLPRDGAR